MTELLVIERRDGSGSTAGLVVRVHAGCLMLGDRLSAAVDAGGEEHQVGLTCTEIRITETHMLDQLDENHGGYVVFRGDGADSVDEGWTLTTG